MGSTASIVADIKQRILSGTYPPGSQVPSTAELCAEFDAADGTVRRALAVLAREGLVSRAQGRRSIVLSPGDPHRSAQDAVVARVRAAIAAGAYPAGSSLPPEAELTEALGTSRYSLREALAELERSGELVNRPGRRRLVAGDVSAAEALYETVMTSIVGDVQSGRLTAGALVPTEAQLRSDFGVSRVTVRRALEVLEADGVLARNAGGRRIVADQAGAQAPNATA